VRYLSVDLDDLVAARSIKRSLVIDIENRIDSAECAQLRGNVTEQRNQLQSIRRLVISAPPSRIDSQARTEFINEVDRSLQSLDQS